VTSADSDIASVLVLQATSTISAVPTEGQSYATSSTIGNATAVCSYAVVASTSYTCTSSGLSAGVPYYYKLYLQDTSGNWSLGATPANGVLSPGNKTVTLGSGIDPAGGTILPGSSATTSDTFTFITSTSTDIIQPISLQFATGTAQGISLLEITNDAGSIVYGSSSNPVTDTPTIALSRNRLTASTTSTQYRVRVTPKTHPNMPVAPGGTYAVTAYVASWVGTNSIAAGTDLGATTTTLTIDNASPAQATNVTGLVT
jgi:hypothetical protein